MQQFDLSTLPSEELRLLLDTARRRGQAEQSYEILREMAARREREPKQRQRRLFRRPRAGEARVIELNLGDPMDPDPEPFEAQPAPTPIPHDLPALTLDEHPRPQPKARDPRPPRRAAWLTAGFAMGMASGAALGLWAGGTVRLGEQPPAAPAPVVAAAAPALQIAPAPVAEPAPESAAAPAPAAAEATPAEAVAPEVAAEPAPTPEAAAETELPPPPPPPPPREEACAAGPNPADRVICETPRLQRLQNELRQAYARALEAHEDRALLRQRQLAWADARNSVTDPAQLAKLYAQRIQKLNAATAEAKRQR